MKSIMKKIVFLSTIIGLLVIAQWASPGEKMSAEEIFKIISGDWNFEFTVSVGQQTTKFTGTITINPTGSTSAEFISRMKADGKEEVETVKMWWDEEKQKLAIMENHTVGYYELTANGWHGINEMDGIPEYGIKEKVALKNTHTLIDKNNMRMIGTAENAEGDVLMKWEGTIKRMIKK